VCTHRLEAIFCGIEMLADVHFHQCYCVNAGQVLRTQIGSSKIRLPTLNHSLIRESKKQNVANSVGVTYSNGHGGVCG
jgi:hypothetical protein